MVASPGSQVNRLDKQQRLWLGVSFAIIALTVTLVVTQYLRTREANAGMLAVKPAPIDGQRAFKYLKEICAMGPHTAGSAANSKVREYAIAHFKKAGAVVREQAFTGTDPKTGKKVEMVNVIAAWNPERKDRVVIGAHYDSRPFPDEDEDPEKRKQPFVGANDPASGIALLMELATHMEKLETTWGVDLVLFDGEELVYGSEAVGNEYFLGSKAFARQYSRGVDNRRIPYRYRAGIVLDLIGHKDLSIEQEQYSLNFAPGLVREVWAVARQLKADSFNQQVGRAVMDDHLALNEGGIPAIDIIDFDYKYWHTSQDLPENCSPASLEEVGKVVSGWLTVPRRKTR